MLTVALLGVLLLILFLKISNKRPEGLPPGEWGWPVLGALAPSGVSIIEHVRSLRMKYGDIVMWRFGSRVMVFLCNFKLIKTAFSKPELQDRPDFFTFDSFTEFQKVGIANSNGLTWHNGRRFALRQLKSLGMGKSSLVPAMQTEARYLVEDFSKHLDKPQPIPMSLNVAILNIIWKMAADIRYEIDDPKIHEFESIITQAFDETQGANMIFDMFPWIIPLTPHFVRDKVGITSMVDKFLAIRQFVEEVIKEHKKTLDPSAPRDYIDQYLIEMENQKGQPDSTMSDLDLAIHVADLFTAGSETTTSTIRWLILYLAKYPEIQAKVQREIDDVVPRNTLPSLEHKDKLPYFEAVIHEVNRIICLLPLGLSHFAAEDTELAGYRIPKGTIIIPNMEVCHIDPSLWDKPNEFNPEHFLDANGKFIQKKDGYLPFSIGRRICPGEAMARMEMYIFGSALVQHFSFSAPEGERFELERDLSKPLFNVPKPLNVVIRKRL